MINTKNNILIDSNNYSMSGPTPTLATVRSDLLKDVQTLLIAKLNVRTIKHFFHLDRQSQELRALLDKVEKNKVVLSIKSDNPNLTLAEQLSSSIKRIQDLDNQGSIQQVREQLMELAEQLDSRGLPSEKDSLIANKKFINWWAKKNSIRHWSFDRPTDTGSLAKKSQIKQNPDAYLSERFEIIAHEKPEYLSAKPDILFVGEVHTDRELLDIYYEILNKAAISNQSSNLIVMLTEGTDKREAILLEDCKINGKEIKAYGWDNPNASIQAIKSNQPLMNAALLRTRDGDIQETIEWCQNKHPGATIVVLGGNLHIRRWAYQLKNSAFAKHNHLLFLHRREDNVQRKMSSREYSKQIRAKIEKPA